MKPDFSKYADGLVPAIVQDYYTNTILMLGFMNEEALERTIASQKVTFYSRSKKRIWTKGETSENYLLVKEVMSDCDNDTLLIKSVPTGPVCHTGKDTCFSETNPGFSLAKLEEVIASRKSNPQPDSYTSSLFAGSINRAAQKLGEEAVELVIESKDTNTEKFLSEAADLLFHYMVLLRYKDIPLSDVVKKLAERHNPADLKGHEH